MTKEHAYKIISALSEGINPITGEILAWDDVCNQGDVVRALQVAEKALASSKGKRVSPENAGKPWTKENDEQLSSMFDTGSTVIEMSRVMKRTKGSIAARLVHIGKIESRESLLENRYD